MTTGQPADLAVARVARDSCRRLVAYLASRSGSIADAEDALAEAFRSALETWPRLGTPQNPEAWLYTTAKRRLIDAHRHHAVHTGYAAELLAIADEAVESTKESATFPDERIKLMFVCAHPAIDVAARTPLMLQVVLGLDAADIASAFLVKPATMGQRLSRAKAKICDAGISYDVPGQESLAGRLDAVLQAIYGAYGIGWDDLEGADPLRRGYALEALELGRLLHAQMPGQAEVMGLLALMLHCEARRDARRSAAGEFVPLAEQDTGLWSKTMIDEADELLEQAASLNRVGPFQLQAAVQSVHNRRATSGKTDWPSIATLYEGLAQTMPTLGMLVARASAWAYARDPRFALQLLDELPPKRVASYQPYWALLATLLSATGKLDEAADAYGRAIGLCVDPVVRRHLAKGEMALRARMRDTCA